MANTIGTAYIQIEPSTEGIGSKLSQAFGKAGTSAGSSFGSALGTAAKVGATAIAGATAAVGGFAMASIEAGKSFDSSMSQVAATMGYSVAELNTEGSVAQQTFEQLSTFAQQMGATTAFSATEAADALNYMALAGYDADTSMQMLPNVLNLAAAGGIELAAASDMVTDAQTALGLSLDQTSIMVDQMAMASSKSNTSVEQLGEAILTIGGNAKMMSGGTQELSTVLGVLADNGIKGSEAGTHLRNILLALTPKSKDAAEAMESIGFNAYDANGELKDMDTIMLDLQKSLEGMSSEERTSTLASMFNKTDLAAINALVDTSQDRWEELYAAIGEADSAAQNMAEVQLDNLEGDITLFKSALEGAEIAISSALTPTIREFVSLTSGGISEITTALQNGDMNGAFNALGETLGQLVTKLAEMAPQLAELAVTLLSALIDGILANIDSITTAAVQIIVTLVVGLVNALPKLIEATPVILKAFVNALIAAAPQLIEAGRKLIETLQNAIQNAWNAVVALASTLVVRLKEAFMQKVAQFKEIGKNIVEGIKTGISNAWNDLTNWLSNLCGNLIEIVQKALHIGSPSKLFASEVGRWIPAGIAVGINDNIGVLNDAMDNMTSTLIDDAIGSNYASQLGSASYGNIASNYTGVGVGGYNQTINVYSPTALSAAEVARQTRNSTRNMVLALRGV